MKKKNIIISGLVALGLIGGGLAYKNYFNEKEVRYITAEVIKGNIEESVIATGKITAQKQVKVGAQVSGQIKTLNVIIGQKVNAGDLIAEIDSINQENTLKDTNASLENFEAQLDAKKVGLEKANIVYERQKKLLSQDATSQEELDDARLSYAVSKSEVAQLQTQIKKTRIALNTAQVNLGYTKIRSPISGIVVSMPVDEGQTVNSNQTAPTIVEIAQLDKVTIKAEIAEGDVVKVKPGLPVYFTVMGASNKVFNSTLKSIDPGPQDYSDGTGTTTASSTSGKAIYYYGSFEVPNPDNFLRIAMTAQTSIVLKEVKDVMVIPYSAVKRKKKDINTVKVLGADNKPIEKEIKIGINNDIDVEVVSGLSVGDKVILGQSDNVTAMPVRNPITGARAR